MIFIFSSVELLVKHGYLNLVVSYIFLAVAIQVSVRIRQCVRCCYYQHPP